MTEKTKLAELCVGRLAEKGDFERSLAECFKGMSVKHLKGYTEETLKNEVERQGGPRMLVPGWLEEKGLRRFLDGQSSAVLESLLKSVRQGQPPINVGSISSLSASVLSNHDPAVVVENDAGFALFESDGRPRRGVGPALWARFVNSQSDKWQWSSESDIGGFVTLVLEEVARELLAGLCFERD